MNLTPFLLHEASGLPMLASSDAATTEAGVHGAADSIDVTRPAFLADRASGAADQIGYDAQWMRYAQAMQQQQGGIIDPASVQAAQDAYNAAASSDTAINGGQYDPDKVDALNGALDQMIGANGWSFGPSQDVASDQITTLPAINVAGSGPNTAAVDAYFGLTSYATAAPEFSISSGVDLQLQALASKGPNTSAPLDSEGFGTVKTGLDWTSTAAATGGMLTGALGKTWTFNWANPSIYDSIVVENGGWAPAWLANPKVNVNVAQSADAARDADYLVDLSKWGKAADWMEGAGTKLGFVGAFVEAGGAFVNRDPAEFGHAVVDGGVVELSVLAGGGLLGLGVGLAWMGLDALAQNYTYNGQKGWTAIWHSTWDAQDQMRQQDPKFYQQLWSQPKE